MEGERGFNGVFAKSFFEKVQTQDPLLMSARGLQSALNAKQPYLVLGRYDSGDIGWMDSMPWVESIYYKLEFEPLREICPFMELQSRDKIKVVAMELKRERDGIRHVIRDVSISGFHNFEEELAPDLGQLQTLRSVALIGGIIERDRPALVAVLHAAQLEHAMIMGVYGDGLGKVLEVIASSSIIKTLYIGLDCEVTMSLCRSFQRIGQRLPATMLDLAVDILYRFQRNDYEELALATIIRMVSTNSGLEQMRAKFRALNQDPEDPEIAGPVYVAIKIGNSWQSTFPWPIPAGDSVVDVQRTSS